MNLRGRLAQLVRAPALQAGSPRFESVTAHHKINHLPRFDYVRLSNCAVKCAVNFLIAISSVGLLGREGDSPAPWQTNWFFRKRFWAETNRRQIYDIGSLQESNRSTAFHSRPVTGSMSVVGHECR